MNGSFFIQQYIDKGFELSDAQSEIDFAIEILFGYSAKDFILGKKLSEKEKNRLQEIIFERLEKKCPIQQLVGNAYFFGRKFYVTKDTLIPRPETEILIVEILKHIKNIDTPKILDIGSGTGCIPITLALENKNLLADSVDISEKAIEVAKKNSNLHKVENRVNFFKSDLFENVNDSYNLIVSNPPYIPIKDKNTLQTEVKDFDPALALFAYDEQGIEFYERIINSASKYIEKNGFICFEIGINQSTIVAKLLYNNNFKNIEITKDLNNIDRVIIAQKT